ncbi:MAG TPA: AsmA-like C-terminal domain-containing protein, partial [Micavibrio sp.]
TIDNIATAFTIEGVKGTEGWNVDVSNITGDFDVRGMTIDYRDPLPPAVNASGHGRLENDVLSIGIDGAAISDMTVKKASVSIDNITKKAPGTAKINVALQAKLPSVLKYIETEPIGMARDKLGLDPGKVKGDADLDIEVSFPTLHDLPKDQVKVKATGTLNDVVLPDVVKTLDLTGGPLKLTVADNKAMLSGKGKIEGRTITLDWEQFLETEGQPYSSKINAQVMADRDLRMKLGIGLDDWLEGDVPVKVAYTEYDGGRGEVGVEGDLAQATVKVNPFGYAKPPGLPGAVTCTAVLQRGGISQIKNLNVKTPELDVQNGTIDFESSNGTSVLRSGNIASVHLNETNAALDFEIVPTGQLKVGMKGAFLDARPFLKKKPKQGPYEGPAILASVDVARMRTNDANTVDKAKIYLDLGKDGLANQLELDAVAGRGAVYMRLKPDVSRGIKVFRLEADDAGAALRAFDVYRNVRGGKIRMNGESKPGKSDNVIYGTAQLSEFNVVNAPALAVLVSAISPTGLPMLLSNEGLYFTRLESKFGWGLRPMGDLYTITDGRTSGSSLGLTFEGSINKEKNYIDINGHVVPMSEINSLISNIPLIGDILTGGSEGGIFAATYTMTGPIEKPVVSINPLSVLTPGIIRRILFED